MSFNTITKPIHIQTNLCIHIQTNLCIHLCVLTSGPPQVPLCAPTVTGPEVKTEKRCRHLTAITPQSLEVSKIKKNKKNFEKFWSSIINILDDQNFSKFFLFFFIFETSSDCDYTYKYIHANYNQSIFKQRSKLTQNT